MFSFFLLFLYKIRKQEGGTGPAGMGGEEIVEDENGEIHVYTCI
jgi:hypothetical protein